MQPCYLSSDIITTQGTSLLRAVERESASEWSADTSTVNFVYTVTVRASCGEGLKLKLSQRGDKMIQMFWIGPTAGLKQHHGISSLLCLILQIWTLTDSQDDGRSTFPRILSGR